MDRAAPKIHFDPANHFPGCDHVQAAREAVDDIHAQTPGPVTLVAVPQPLRPVLPTSSVGATVQSAVRVNELMIWISFPVRRFTAASAHHARAVWRPARFRFDGSSQMH